MGDGQAVGYQSLELKVWVSVKWLAATGRLSTGSISSVVCHRPCPCEFTGLRLVE